MKFDKKFFYIIIGLFFILGFIFRLKAFLFSRPLWLDECFLFHNIYSKNIFGYFSVLEYSQSSPPFFLILEKLSVYIFGIGEKALRIIPFLSSIISLPIFYIFSKKFLKTRLALIVAFILFAINCNCIYFAQELKQYSTDVLCFMVLFMILNKITAEKLNRKNITIYCTVTTMFPFLSITSYFLIIGWFFREILKKGKEIKKLIIIQIPWFVLLYFYYICILSPQRNNIVQISNDFWQQGFLSMNFMNDFVVIKNLILYCFAPCSFFIVLFILLLLGIFVISKNYKNEENSFLLNSVLIVIIASLCQLYPLLERIALFLIPVFIIFVSKSLDLVSKDRKLISGIIIIIYLLSFHNYDIQYLEKCYKSDIWFYKFRFKGYPDFKKAFKILKTYYSADDTVIVNIMSKPVYDYYKLYYDFEPIKEIYTKWIEDGKSGDFEKQLEELTVAGNTYWLIFYTDYSKTQEVTKGYMSFINKNHILSKFHKLVYVEILEQK